jgi:teichuronic acid biosynthesis glycosyltransferase TuaG
MYQICLLLGVSRQRFFNNRYQNSLINKLVALLFLFLGIVMDKSESFSLTVSIITPVFNSEKFLLDTITSVQEQTYPNWEMLITDDCSTDGSIELIQKIADKDARIKLLKLDTNSGSGVARNTSIEASTGDVIAFIDSDDLWDSDFLEKSLSFMEKKKAGIVFSSYRRFSENLEESLGEFVVPEYTDYSMMLKSCAISCLTGMYHVERCGGKVYLPKIRKRQDYCIWLALLKHVDKAYGIKDVLATYRVRSNSVSRNKFKTAQYQWRVYRDIENLSLTKSAYYFVHYATKGLVKNFGLLGRA